MTKIRTNVNITNGAYWRIAEVPTPNRLLADPTVFKTVLQAVAVNNPYWTSIPNSNRPKQLGRLLCYRYTNAGYK